MLEPVFSELVATGAPLTVYSQDDPTFPENVAGVIDDTELEVSFRLDVDTVPTLIKFDGGKEVARAIGWNRAEWEKLTGLDGIGGGLPEARPGCGAKNVEPGIAEELAVRYGDVSFGAREIELDANDDDIEACYDRGWSDGLPVVPPTDVRVYRMLQGTKRKPDEIVAVIPPDLAECTVEKVAINAVMAGCKPEYLPVVLAAVEAACQEAFCMHGLLATTWFSGPMVIVNGPITKRIGMNSGMNALGQGNRANATIGRALQLVIRNVGGGRPGGVDRSALGHPGKYTFCFAEKEDDSPWESLATERGVEDGQSAVTLFAADGVQGLFDQQSREPESLARTFAGCLRTVAHPKIAMACDAFLVVTPEHARVFREAGWTKQQLKDKLAELLQTPGKDMIRGAGGIAEGLPAHLEGVDIPKFRPGALNIVYAGGGAGLFSAIIPGWLASGEMGSSPVTRVIGN
jgi:hypothetical protein